MVRGTLNSLPPTDERHVLKLDLLFVYYLNAESRRDMFTVKDGMSHANRPIKAPLKPTPPNFGHIFQNIDLNAVNCLACVGHSDNEPPKNPHSDDTETLGKIADFVFRFGDRRKDFNKCANPLRTDPWVWACDDVINIEFANTSA